MILDINDAIKIKSYRFFTPLEKNWWRMLGFYLETPIIFSSGLIEDHYTEISYKTSKIRVVSEEIKVTEVNKNNLLFNQEEFSFLSKGTQINFIEVGQTLVINQDIITPIFKMLEFKQDPINSDMSGEAVAKNKNSFFPNNIIFAEDYFLNFIRLIGLFLNKKFSLDSYPYIIFLTFNINEYQNNYDQIRSVLKLIQKWPLIKYPTFFLDGGSNSERATFTSLWKEESDLKLIKESIEIGLKTPSGARNQYDVLKQRKDSIEEQIGKQVTSHLSDCDYFEWSESWAMQLKTGFFADMSVGYGGIGSYWRGTNLPIYFPDPDGKDIGLWTIGTTTSNRHFPQLKNAVIDSDSINIFKNLIKKYGIITLGWDIGESNQQKCSDNFKILEEILEQASKDGALVCGIHYIAKEFKKKWDALYPNLLWKNNIQEEEKFIPNLDVKNEIPTYVDIFNLPCIKVRSIDHSIDSLLSILPHDVEKIADIGCGPGLLARRIPSFYKVICIDLDEKILAPVDRYKKLGSITKIPLKDNSVELVIAMDILEHLSDQELENAIVELSRVSSKYVYIQTPHNENLSFGRYLCLTCNKTSHINHHKQSFVYKKLTDLFNQKGLKEKIVNLTGDMTTSCYYPKYYSEKLNLSNYKNSGVVCHFCGETSNFLDASSNDSLSLKLEKISSSLYLNPWYSEIGILFSKNNLSIPLYTDKSVRKFYSKSGKIEPIDSPLLIQYNEMNFTEGGVKAKNDISFLETIPYYVSRNAYVESLEEGINLYPSNYASYISFYTCFSNLPIPCKVQVSINGLFPLGSTIACSTFNIQLQEIETIKLNVEKENENYTFVFNKEDIIPIFLFTFLDKGKPFSIRKVSYSRLKGYTPLVQDPKYMYSFKQGQGAGHIEYVDGETVWRLLLPADEEKICFSYTIEKYVENIIKQLRDSATMI